MKVFIGNALKEAKKTKDLTKIKELYDKYKDDDEFAFNYAKLLREFSKIKVTTFN